MTLLLICLLAAFVDAKAAESKDAPNSTNSVIAASGDAAEMEREFKELSLRDDAAQSEVDKWTDATPELMAKLTAVSQTIGQAQLAAFGAPRAGVIVAGFEVEHLHIHVFPAYGLENFSFAAVDNNPDPALMDANAEKLRVALREAGHGEFVPES